MSLEMNLGGGCFCGRVRYSAAVLPKNCSMCHCRMCQRWTGSPAAMTANFDLDDIRWAGESPETFATSKILDRQFCKLCGTSIGYRYRVGRFSSTQFILVATLDDPNSVDGPRHHFGIEDHLEKWTWVAVLNPNSEDQEQVSSTRARLL